MLQSHCRTVLRESYCQSLRTPGQHVLLCLCTPRLNAPFGGPFMGYPFPRPLPSSLYQKKSRGKDFRHFAPLWFSSQHPSTPTQPSLAALQPKIHKMAGAFSWSSFSNKMISPHYCWHWVGQKVHSVLFHNILWKNLNKLFDQPNTSINPKGNHSWIFIGRTDVEAETLILWPPDAKNWVLGKDPDAGKDGRQEKKGMTEDEMVEWHHRLNGHEFEQALGVVDGQGSMACCSSWGHKESGMTEWLNGIYLSLVQCQSM